MGKYLQNDYDSTRTDAGVTAPREGLQYDPVTHRWKKPVDQTSTPRTPDFQSPVIEPVAVKSLEKLVAKMEGMVVMAGLADLAKDVVPVEQLKGDLARNFGHHIDRLVALDIESRRLFFIDSQKQPLYLEFDSAQHGFQILRVGFQGEISKEYNVVDLEPDDSEEWVGTEHEEADAPDDTPGMIPAGTPGDKPTDEDVLDGQGGHASGQGWGDKDSEDGGRRSVHRSITQALAQVEALIGPSTPGGPALGTLEKTV